AARGGNGMEVDVSKIPQRDEDMTPYEIMLSESQERMLIIPSKDKGDKVKEICEKWELDWAVIGHVTGDGILRVKNGDKIEAEIPARALTHMCPVYHPQSEKPEYLSKAWEFNWDQLPVPKDMSQVLLDILASPSIASKEWVYSQYDHMVGVNTVVPPGSDAGVLRIKGTNKALATCIDGNGKYCHLDPYTGGAITVAEASRNLVCSGALPLALTDCLNFGSPEKPQVYWQFEQAVQGMSEAARVLNTPVVSGNVSLYNEYENEPIYPTPVVGMVGLIEDLSHIRSQGFVEEGDRVILLGETRGELGASTYLEVVHGVETGRTPTLNLEKEKAVQELCLKGIKEGLIKSAHDCSDGGLAAALAECCISGGIGANMELPRCELGIPELLFSESQSRIIVTVNSADVDTLMDLAKTAEVPAAIIGSVGGGKLQLSIEDHENVLDIEVEKMEETWRGAIQCLMN
ncbi:MAG: phosphoribosylformylglycinamidine synthase II, partial [Clostridia bacterium]|nr:phosphoribosylformylglycinamidine synthase II [Clostridia bacterium]